MKLLLTIMVLILCSCDTNSTYPEVNSCYASSDFRMIGKVTEKLKYGFYMDYVKREGTIDRAAKPMEIVRHGYLTGLKDVYPEMTVNVDCEMFESASNGTKEWWKR